MRKEVETIQEVETEQDLEKVSFKGLYFLGMGFAWQILWQLAKVVDYASIFHIPADVFRWGLIGLVGVVVVHLMVYVVYLETKKDIDSLGLLSKYVIGLVLGYFLSKLLIMLVL